MQQRPQSPRGACRGVARTGGVSDSLTRRAQPAAITRARPREPRSRSHTSPGSSRLRSARTPIEAFATSFDTAPGTGLPITLDPAYGLGTGLEGANAALSARLLRLFTAVSMPRLTGGQRTRRPMGRWELERGKCARVVGGWIQVPLARTATSDAETTLPLASRGANRTGMRVQARHRFCARRAAQRRW